VAYGAPLVSGKDSMKNDSEMGGVKISVPPTLLVSALGQIDDVRHAVTLDPKRAGDVVYLLGVTREETGGSEYFRLLGATDGAPVIPGQPRRWVGNRVPRLRVRETVPLYAALRTAIEAGAVRSATAAALGGWGAAFARAAIAGDLGLALDLGECADLGALGPAVALFSESLGRVLVTVAPEDASRFEACLTGLPCRRVGRVTAEPRLVVRANGSVWFDLAIAELARAFEEALRDA
jgi:phosphoribosylformylglycinamidine synthase